MDLTSSTAQASANTALTATVKVPARQQELTKVNMLMPAGLLGRLTVADECSVADARANACGAGSEIGTVTAKVGDATAPFSVNGKVYLTAGIDGSIAAWHSCSPPRWARSISATCVTLAKITIEGNDLRMRIVADEVPTRVKGIPLNISELAIRMSKDGIVLNRAPAAPRTPIPPSPRRRAARPPAPRATQRAAAPPRLEAELQARLQRRPGRGEQGRPPDGDVDHHPDRGSGRHEERRRHPAVWPQPRSHQPEAARLRQRSSCGSGAVPGHSTVGTAEVITSALASR